MGDHCDICQLSIYISFVFKVCFGYADKKSPGSVGSHCKIGTYFYKRTQEGDIVQVQLLLKLLLSLKYYIFCAKLFLAMFSALLCYHSIV